MRHARVARPYAQALFELARERGELETVGRELADAVATFASNTELRALFTRPWTPKTVKRRVAVDVAATAGFTKLTTDFLALVAAGNRTDHLAAIAEAYQRRLDDHDGRARVVVRSAVPLNDDERRLLSVRLATAFGSATVVLEEIVDAAILGGVVVEYRGTVFDASLAAQLDRMRRRMAKGDHAHSQPPLANSRRGPLRHP